MSALLRLEAYDAARTAMTVVDSSVPPGANPTVLRQADWGNAIFEAQMSGPRGTLGRRAAAYQVKDRDVSIPLRIFGASKQDVITRVSALWEQVDLIRRFGGRIIRRDHNQTYRQHLEVLSTPGLAMTWTQAFGNRDVAEVAFQATCAPYAYGDPLDILDAFDTDTEADYTVDGAGSLANYQVTGGVLDPTGALTTELRAIHTARGYLYYDHQVTVEAHPGTTLLNFKAGAIVKRVDAANYLEVFVDDNGTNSRLTLRKVVAGTPTTLAGPTNLAARIAAGTPFHVRARIERNTVYAEYFAGQPQQAAAPTLSLTAHTLSSADAAVFGMGVQGRGGIVFTPQHTDAQIRTFTLLPFVYRAASLPDVFRLPGLPGDVDALMDVAVAVNGQPALDFALVGWAASPPVVNLLDMGDNLGAVPTGAWAITAVTNINAAATSVTRITTQAKYGASSLEVTAASASADSGAQRRTYRRFRRGVTYTFRVWVRSSTSTANVAARVGNGAANDVATSANVALSATWQLITVTWTPTADREDAHITVIRRTSGVADVFQMDAEEVYEGTVAPTLQSQVEGRGGPAPFGIIEAENGVESGSTVTADASGSAGFVTSKSALVVVDANALTRDDLTEDALVEVWGRVRVGSNFASVTAKAKATPLRAGALPVWTLEHGAGGRTITLPLTSTAKSRMVRFGTLPLPVRRDGGRYQLNARLDFVAGAATATGYKFPTTNETDGDGTWDTPANAGADDNSDSTATTDSAAWRWGTFTFGVPGGATIVGIEATVEAYNVNAAAAALNCHLSWNAGTSRTAAKRIPTTGYLTSPSRLVFVLGGPTDLWGRSWTDTELNNTNFRVILDSVGQAGGGLPAIDYVKINVYYTTAADVPYVDQLILVPARRRAVTPTGKDPVAGEPWLEASTSVDLERTIAVDLAGSGGFGASTQDTPGSAPARGLGGSLLEIPVPSTDVLVRLSELIPDAPARVDTSESVTIPATVHFAVTPRWAVLRD